MRKKGELMLIHANYVQCKSYFLHQCQFIACVAASASSEMHSITIKEQKSLIYSIAFALCVIGILEVGASHSMGYLYPKHFLIERETMIYLKKR